MMTTLRALVGAGFLLAVIGFVVFVPIGWALALYSAEKTSAERLTTPSGIGGASAVEIIKSRPSLQKAELVQKKILLRAATEGGIYQLVGKDR
jgi:hypothetical protein